jgi:adenosylcobinamide kinase/adenosylcobinamide-phosphate guanylyltransferase
VTRRRALVLGGARSGKSAFAERLAIECGEPVIYVATAPIDEADEEMLARIAHHRATRSRAWRTLERRAALADGVALDAEATTALIEDLTLLLSNHMEDDPSTAEARTLAEIEALLALEVNVVFVTNEVGMGVVPAYPLGRQFRDALGRVNQAAASACAEVYLIVAGLPLRMK